MRIKWIDRWCMWRLTKYYEKRAREHTAKVRGRMEA